MGELPSKPVVFVSHRHTDLAIAERVTQLLRDLFDDQIEVFNTSTPSAEGVKPAEPIEPAIRNALGQSSLVFLGYTDPDADWSWCFYECGLARDPRDEVPTKVIVLNFSGAEPRVLSGNKHVRIEGDEDTTDADTTGRREVESFVQSLVNNEDLRWSSHDVQTTNPEKVTEVARLFWRDMCRLAPAVQERLTTTMLETLSMLPAEDRHERFVPLLQSASNALRWGLRADSTIRELFIDYWDKQFLDDLSNLANRRLVFNPGHVTREWGRLLERVADRLISEPKRAQQLGRPVIALVSSEDDHFSFWEEAMRSNSDASFYENPLRKAAGRLTTELAGQLDDNACLVERVFVFSDEYFRSGSEEEIKQRVGQLLTVATWMHNAGIVTSVGYRRGFDQPEWRDFGIVGDLAVSKFRSLARTHYRSLVEDFSQEALAEATKAWEDLNVVWRTSEGLGEELVRERLC